MSKPGADTVELHLPCHPQFLTAARLLVAELGARCGLSITDVDDLKVAVSEAITNVLDHAYKAEPSPNPVVVRYRLGAGEITVEVEDRGAGFDARKLQPVRPPQPGAEGGLGLYLVHEMADHVKVESAPGSGTKVTITKRRHG